MNENKHTPEPWSVGHTRIEKYASGDTPITAIHYGSADSRGNCIAFAYGHGGLSTSESDARRIVACVNRLAQFTTEQIEDFGYDLFAEDRPRLVEAQNEIHLLKKQRDELLAAIEQFLDPEGNPPTDTGEWREVMRVIASVKGEQ